MARTTVQNEQMRDVSKQKIRTAALKKFSQKGLFGTRIQDIAEAAGISQGLMYRYYASKDEIYVDLIENSLDRLNEASVAANQLEISAKEKILTALTELYKTIEKSEVFNQTCRLIMQAMNSAAIPKAAQISIDQKRDVPYQAFASIMKQGQEEGSIVEGDPYELAVLFWSTINGLAIFNATRDISTILPDAHYIASMFLKEE